MIKDEEDLHNYKNLLNAMAALFYTNHKASDVQVMFKEWLRVYREKPKVKGASRAVPAIEIDTELANAQYENQNEQENLIGNHLNDEEGINADINHNHQNMIRIEGEEENDHVESSKRHSEENEPVTQNEDELQDNFVKGFLKDLNKVGPFSKEILSYSYPPLLYQRGDDSEEDEEDFMGEGEEDEDDSAGGYNLDGDDGFDMENLMGQDLDDLDQHNADLKQQEEIIDGLFAQNHELDSPDGIENVDISDIQNMINKSSESPALDDQDMLNNMDFNQAMSKEELDFYNNLQRVTHNDDDDDMFNPGDMEAVIDQMQ